MTAPLESEPPDPNSKTQRATTPFLLLFVVAPLLCSVVPASTTDAPSVRLQKLAKRDSAPLHHQAHHYPDHNTQFVSRSHRYFPSCPVHNLGTKGNTGGNERRIGKECR